MPNILSKSVFSVVLMTIVAGVPMPAAVASPQAAIQPAGKSGAPPKAKPCGRFAEDAMTLIVTDSGKELAREAFCSSYGRASAKTATDLRGRSYVLLEYGEGHGTNAVTTFLKVYRLQPELLEMARIPISWRTGPTQRFTFAYDFTSDPSNSLIITLKGSSDADSTCCVPPEKSMTIKIEAGKQ